MDNHGEFIREMTTLDPTICDYADALTFAMNHVPKRHTDKSVYFFGRIGSGVFFSGDSEDRCRWYPDSVPSEVIGSLKAEFGAKNLGY